MGKLNNEVEELADYLSVNAREEYEAIVKFGRLRFKQGQLNELKEVNKLNDTGIRHYVVKRLQELTNITPEKAEEAADRWFEAETERRRTEGGW